MQESTKQDLRKSVIDGNFEEVKRIFQEGKVNINANLNYSRLSSASGILSSIPMFDFMTHAKDNFLEIAQAAYAENKDNASYRAIHWAARKGYLDMLKYLCEQGADINITNFIGNTALHVALYYNQKEAVRILLEYKPNLDIKNTGSLLGNIKENFAPMHYAALYGDAESIILLLQAGATADTKGLCDLMPLHFAAITGDVEKIKCLLSTGQDVNCVDSDGKTPLYQAVLASLTNPCAVEAVLFLLEHQADPNLVDNKNNTPMDALIKLANEQKLDIAPEQLQVVQHLLAWGADVEKFNECINKTQSFNFSLDLNHLLIRQCAEQKTQILSLKKALCDAQNTSISQPGSPHITTDNMTMATTSMMITLASNASPTINRVAPPSPPLLSLNSVPRKKYRENTNEERMNIKKLPTSTPADDLIAALKERFIIMRRDIEPLNAHDKASPKFQL